MSIIIEGAELPKGSGAIHLEIHSDGTVIMWKYGESDTIIGTARQLPPHGALKDADELGRVFREKGQETGGLGGLMAIMAAECIDAADTIIPADPADKTSSS